MKMNSRSDSSGQVLVILIILLALAGAGFWWLTSNKQQMAKDGKEFARDAIQRIAVRHDQAFFLSRLSPQARMNFPQSMVQELFAEIDRLGTPVGPPDVQGEIKFQSQFFEPQGNFHAHVDYPTRSAEVNISISHPVGRWQIDDATFLPGKER